MFQGKTTIVVGAGASEEFRLPLGNELTGKIATAINVQYEDLGRRKSGAEDIELALRQYAKAKDGNQNINPYLPACRAIAAGMREAPSIDEFIHQRRDDKLIEVCGKLGIVYCILHEERGSNLYYKQVRADSTIDFSQCQQTWLANLRRFLTDGCTVNEVVGRLTKVRLIIFNYDRCVEHYLVHSLQNNYTIKEADAAELLRSLEIIHPYGVVGNLPWQDAANNVEYGETSLIGRLPGLAESIRTFTEQAQQTDVQDRIRQLIQDSHLILFLGFAFHKQNLELLTPPDKSKCTAKVIGTAYGVSNADLPVVQYELARRFSNDQMKAITLRNDLKCYTLFDQYRHKFGSI